MFGSPVNLIWTLQQVSEIVPCSFSTFFKLFLIKSFLISSLQFNSSQDQVYRRSDMKQEAAKLEKQTIVEEPDILVSSASVNQGCKTTEHAARGRTLLKVTGSATFLHQHEIKLRCFSFKFL